MTKYALIIPSFENNIGYKMAAVNTFLQHTPKNMDIYFVYGGNQNLCNKYEFLMEFSFKVIISLNILVI